MKVRITSVTAPSVSAAIRAVTTALEDQLGLALEKKDYGGGVQQFSAFYVSVDSDLSQNQPYCQMHNRSGKYKDIVTGKMVGYVSLAVPVDPERVLSAAEALPKLLQDLLIEQLEQPTYQLPKNFDRELLLADVKAALA